MFGKLHSIVFVVFIVLITCVPGALAQNAGQQGAQAVSPLRQNQVQLRTRIMGIKDETSLDAALAKLVGENRLTQEQATKIKTQWQKQQGRGGPLTAITRLRAIQDEGKLNEALTQLQADGKITQDQADRIQKQWQKQHDQASIKPKRQGAARVAKTKQNARTSQILNRIRGAKTEAQLDAMLNKLVSKGRVTQEQAARLKEQWKKRR